MLDTNYDIPKIKKKEVFTNVIMYIFSKFFILLIWTDLF